MRKQLIIVGIVVILLTVGLSGCNKISSPLAIEEDSFEICGLKKWALR